MEIKRKFRPKFRPGTNLDVLVFQCFDFAQHDVIPSGVEESKLPSPNLKLMDQTLQNVPGGKVIQ